MAEWAFRPYETVNSILPGYTRNPYAPDRVTAGSTGATAAAPQGALGLGSNYFAANPNHQYAAMAFAKQLYGR
jgi:Asp-tRNA(Asn)/Glu-tRNA(Gln) amidotransferase A subunit family amidase